MENKEETEFQKLIKQYDLRISKIDLKSLKSIENCLKHFSNINEEIRRELNSNSQLKPERTKEILTHLYKIMNKKFEEKSNKHKKEIKELIEQAYSEILIDDTTLDSSYDYLRKINKKDETLLKNLTKNIIHHFQSNFRHLVAIQFKVDPNIIPHFLLEEKNKNIKKQIKIILKAKKDLLNEENLEQNKEIKVLDVMMEKIMQKGMKLFSLSNEQRNLIMETLIWSNIRYFNISQNALKYFIANLDKYMKFIQPERDFYSYETLTYKYMILLDYQMNEVLEKFMNDYINIYFDVNSLLKAILSFNLMLHNIFINSQQINDTAKCNAIEHEILKNIILFLNNTTIPVSVLNLNTYIENNLLPKIILKNLTPVLKKNESMYFHDIHNALNTSSNPPLLEKITHFIKENNLKEINPTKPKNKLFSMLKEVVSAIQKEKDKTVDFSSTNITPYENISMGPHCIICISGFLSETDVHTESWENLILEQSKKADLFFYNWGASTKAKLLTNVVGTLSKFSYAAYENYKTYKKVSGTVKSPGAKEKSTTMMEKITNIEQALKSESNNKTFDKFVEGFKNYNKDNIFNETKEKSKEYGQLLAYIIASRTVFQYQTITLIGFSLGCNVIKHCLATLYKLKDLNIGNIIQNVVFIAGATTFNNMEKWPQYFDEVIAGRIINCHCDHDKILKYLYTVSTGKIAIGGEKVDFEKFNFKRFENYDFSEFKLGHTQYRKALDKVLSKINI